MNRDAFASEFKKALKKWKKSKEDIQIIFSGGTTGPDQLGISLARELEIDYKVFLPKWKLQDKAAGPLRNLQMAREATHAFIIWNGISTGTKNMIENVKKMGLQLYVHDYSNLQ